MRSLGVALAAGLGALGSLGAGCGDPAVLLLVGADDLAAPGDLDGFCLAIGDRESGGGEFARHYAFGDGEVDGLPQSLAVEPGGASSAFAWVRGYRGGLEVARDADELSFGDGEVELTLARCPGGPGGAPSPVDAVDLPAGSRAVLSIGRTGSSVVAVGQGEAVVFSTRGGALARLGGAVPSVSGAGAADLVALDADGDCDDDVLVVPADEPPVLWRRQPDGAFLQADEALGGAPVSRAAAALDVDGDGDVDLALAGEEDLSIWLNDGAGRFVRNPAAPAGDGAVDVIRLGAGDLDGDGAVDLVAARGATEAAPARVLFGDGNGVFDTAPAALPELPLLVRALLVRDVNGDGFPDVVLGGEEMPVRLYLNRTDGRLEDRSFVSLPGVEPIAVTSLAAGDWDGDCLADLVIGLAEGGEPLLWRGTDAGLFVDDGSPSAAGGEVLLGDADDDGDLDLLAIEGGGALEWVAR